MPVITSNATEVELSSDLLGNCITDQLFILPRELGRITGHLKMQALISGPKLLDEFKDAIDREDRPRKEI